MGRVNEGDLTYIFNQSVNLLHVCLAVTSAGIFVPRCLPHVAYNGFTTPLNTKQIKLASSVNTSTKNNISGPFWYS